MSAHYQTDAYQVRLRRKGARPKKRSSIFFLLTLVQIKSRCRQVPVEYQYSMVFCCCLSSTLWAQYCNVGNVCDFVFQKTQSVCYNSIFFIFFWRILRRKGARPKKRSSIFFLLTLVQIKSRCRQVPF